MFAAPFALPRHAAFSLSPGLPIDCLTGRLWITQEGDLRDLVIEAGQSYVPDRPGRAVVSALDDARLVVHGCAGSRS